MKQVENKAEIKEVKSLIRKIRKGYGKSCPELNMDCPVCKATILIAYLGWHLDSLEWPDKIPKQHRPK